MPTEVCRPGYAVDDCERFLSHRTDSADLRSPLDVNTMTGDHPLNVYRITADSTTLTSVLPTVLHLSNLIFNTAPGSKYASLDEWIRRISTPGAVIVYSAPRPDPERPDAFLLAHRRLHTPPLACGEEASLHIWLAGVLPERRKEGCLARMVDTLSSENLLPLTVCTTPELYPDMWRWLMARGWEVQRELGGRESDAQSVTTEVKR